MADEQPSARPTSVYRYYDENDLLLYVGITSRAVQRQSEHNATKEWWPFVARQEVEHYPSRPAAASREQGLIRAHRPPFNIQHNPGHSETRSAYLALATKGGRVRNIYPALCRGLGKARLNLTVERVGNTLILTTLATEARKIEPIDGADAEGVTVAFAGYKGTRARLLRARVDPTGLTLHVVCRRNAESCTGATLMLRMPNGRRERPTIKRIDLRGPGEVY